MNPIDILIIAVLAVILGSVVFFLRKAKKKGVRCVGCPDAGKCAGHCGGCTGQCSGCSSSKY